MGEGAGVVSFRRPPGGALPVPIAALRADVWLPEPAAIRPATTPAAMTMQAPSTVSTVRMGGPGGLEPEAECLPLTPETDVLTTIRSRAFASDLPARGPGARPGRGDQLAPQTCWNGWVPA